MQLPDVNGFLSGLAILWAGYSMACGLSLLFTHFRADHYQGEPFSRCMGLVLIMSLIGLQTSHALTLLGWQPWVSGWAYQCLLFVVAPAFHLFSQPVLRPTPPKTSRWLNLVHAAPIGLVFALPHGVATPLAFGIGAGYLFWLAKLLYALRHARASYQREMGLLGAAILIALGVLVLALTQATPLSGQLFIALYAIAIGLAFFLVQTTLALRPSLSSDIQETAQASYEVSTLVNVDCESALAKLGRLTDDARVYTDPSLSLRTLADQMGLSTHQLSELINTRLGKGFSRYLREKRVAAACVMLIEEPSASVLSVGLNVGFTSQSNFYEAFREVEGMTPGQYRKHNKRKAP